MSLTPTQLVVIFVVAFLLFSSLDIVRFVLRRRADYWARQRDLHRAELEAVRAKLQESRLELEQRIANLFADILMGPFHNRCGFCGHHEVLNEERCPGCGRLFIDIMAVNEKGARMTESDLAVVRDIRSARGFPIDPLAVLRQDRKTTTDTDQTEAS